MPDLNILLKVISKKLILTKVSDFIKYFSDLMKVNKAR